ncbi:MAG: type II toxin-antitoxin system Phd/YefM family antitoxin [Deltaproteobacteria bacterium]|nr:type II toxin-antitoxin system Phd/YefM family antitoxin [Deltaproteobacteria bacterium]
MESIGVGELKSRFSEVLERVKRGERIVISYGKKRQRIAVLVPYEDYSFEEERRMGLLKDRGSCVIHRNFKMTDEELINQ